jgi:AraC-like DNA-binding protein
MIAAPSSDATLEQALIRSGLRPYGGNMIRRSISGSMGSGPPDSHVWVNGYVGLFVFDKAQSDVIDVDLTVLRDVIASGVVLNDTATDLVVGKKSFEAKSCAMTMVYLPRGERFHYATRSALGLRSVTMVLDLKSFTRAYGLQSNRLPASLRRMLDRREAAIEQVRPSPGVMRVVEDLGSRQGMYPAIPALYFEGKACELISAWLRQLQLGNDVQSSSCVIDERTRNGVSRAKSIIDCNARLPLCIDALSREAAMNRTKLRAAFKEMYGTTIFHYSTATVMQRAERYLRDSGASVGEAARVAGYANPSSFIVAYKRFFGASPGRRRH